MKTIQQALKELDAKGENIDDNDIDNALEGVDSNTYDIDLEQVFDSPGLDISTYAVAYLDDNKLKVWIKPVYYH